jgi:Uma2 family endonuclease
MSKALKRDATYADLCEVPQNFVAEILGGELYASPRPAFPHARAESALVALIAGPFQFGVNGPEGWLILVEPELHFGADVVVPDIAGWRSERVGDWADAAYLTLAPDWLCEVVSPSTERIDRTKKLNIYAREGVRYVWFLDPLRQSLEVLHVEGQRWSLSAIHEGDRRARAEPFDAVEFELGALWAKGLQAG